jgi:hypothetical protein
VLRLPGHTGLYDIWILGVVALLGLAWRRTSTAYSSTSFCASLRADKVGVCCVCVDTAAAAASQSLVAAIKTELSLHLRADVLMMR